MIAWLHATINTFSHTDLGKKNTVKYMQLIFFFGKMVKFHSLQKSIIRTSDKFTIKNYLKNTSTI